MSGSFLSNLCLLHQIDRFMENMFLSRNHCGLFILVMFLLAKVGIKFLNFLELISSFCISTECLKTINENCLSYYNQVKINKPISWISLIIKALNNV